VDCKLTAAMLGTQNEVREVEEAAAVAPPTTASASRSWQNWVSLGAFVVNLVITYLSLTGIFGETNSDLSDKYQTLVTPAGFAFSIWGLIFTWEAVWAVAQMFPRFCQSAPVKAAAPWWWAACLFQCLWTVAFAQEWIPVSLCFMLSILVSLLGAVLSVDQQKLSLVEYLLLRAPFALHLGWIIAAANVNLNVVADWDKASPGVLLGLGIASLAAVVAIATFFTCGVKTSESIVCFVAAWALMAVGVELGDGAKLSDPSRYNPYMWPDETLEGVRYAAIIASVASLLLAVTSLGLNALAAFGPKRMAPSE